MNPFLLTDGYKTGHHVQYLPGITLVNSNFTPRSNKYAPKGCTHVVSFGQQLAFMQIHKYFQEEFFNRRKRSVCDEIKKELSIYLNTDYTVDHIEALHDLGYLPIHVKSLPEGVLVPMRVPVLTIYNTHPDFFWITNYLETIISNILWKPMTSATIARTFYKVLSDWQMKTDEERAWIVPWQGHDFSMRGLDSIDATIASGLGHALSFTGSDSLPVIHGARTFYNATGAVIGSVNATEHSVMCAGSEEDEMETFRRLLTIYPSGILSVVSDTWNLWRVCVEYLPLLKDQIMKRDGKLVIRPDSGNPVDIICGLNTSGDPFADLSKNEPEWKGVVELLWDTFGGTINRQGFKVLDSHIGAIYGDSITLDRAEEICKRLAMKGFASTNVVLGIGSFTYQLNTRDTFGFAMKATYVEFKDQFGIIHGREIYKNPVTDDGIKKSAVGLLKVIWDSSINDYRLIDRQSWEEESASDNELKTIYLDGKFTKLENFDDIRKRLRMTV